MRGLPSADTERLELFVSPGTIPTKALRVYSAPSETLLLYMATHEFSASEEGQAWETLHAADPRARVTTDVLSDAAPHVTLPPRPPQDDRIQVWVYGTWPDGVEEDRLIADGMVGNGEFSFTTSVEGGADCPPPTDAVSGQR